MNGVHDLGGMQDFGPVVAEPNEPVFHAEWERRVFAMRIAMGSWRRWNIYVTRWSVEQLPPLQYLSSSYYEKWFDSLVQLLEQSGLVEAEALRRARGARIHSRAVFSARDKRRRSAAPECRADGAWSIAWNSGR